MSFSICLRTNTHQKAESICPSLESELSLWFSVANSVQFSSVAQLCLTLQPHEPQYARPPRPSPTPGIHHVHWVGDAIYHLILCHPLFLLPSIFPRSGSFQMSQLFASGGQSIGASASTSVLPMNTQDWSPLGCTGWISLQSKGLSRVFSNTTVQKHQFFGAQLSLWSNSHIHTRLRKNQSFD